MTKARRSEGPRAPLFYSAAALLLLCGKFTTAQTVDLSRLEQCAGLETQDRKLACFEAIIATDKAPETPEPEAIKHPESEPPVAEIEAAPEATPAAVPPVEVTPHDAPAAVATSTIAVTVTTAPPVEIAQQEAPSVDAATESTPAAVTTSIAAAAVAPESTGATVTAAPESTTSSQIGEEHLDHPDTEKEANEDEVFHATVTEVSKGRNRTLYFHFANGQVWRQNEGRTLTYPKGGEFDVIITRGMMGDYRLRIGDNGRMVRIRRVE